MTDPEAARALFAVGERDLAAMGHMLDEESFADEIFGLHAQQAAEKMLKAWLCARGQEYPLTHDLRYLVSMLLDSGAEASAFMELEAYTPYATIFRYDEDAQRTPPFERQVAIRKVGALRDVVRGLVPE